LGEKSQVQQGSGILPALIYYRTFQRIVMFWGDEGGENMEALPPVFLIIVLFWKNSYFRRFVNKQDEFEGLSLRLFSGDSGGFVSVGLPPVLAILGNFNLQDVSCSSIPLPAAAER
jgi:hypothetical protein